MSREVENKLKRTEQNEAVETEKISAAAETAKPACACCCCCGCRE